jgi:hypothetical protein
MVAALQHALEEQMRRVLMFGLAVSLFSAPALADFRLTAPAAPAGAPWRQVQDASPDTTEDESGEFDEGAPYPDNFSFTRIPVTFPASAEAPGLSDFLINLRTSVEKHDEAALVAAIAPKIFWDRDFGGGFDEAATGTENFRQAFQIGIPDILPEYADDGWVRLSLALNSGRFSTEPDHPGSYCTPVFPELADAAAAEKTFAQINMGDDEWRLYWGFVDGRAEVRTSGKADAASIGAVENEAVPVHAWDAENSGWVEIGMPDGRKGFVEAPKVGTWIDERICFGQTGGKWSIVGYIGGGD